MEFEGRDGTRSLCHLIVFYPAGHNRLICVVGNFDHPVGASTTAAIEVVATAVADRLGHDEFRLLEWYPHGPGDPFSEVTLTKTEPQQLLYGQLLIADAPQADTRPELVTVRFTDPNWKPMTENDLAELLGESTIRALGSFAGIRGDYHPERLFASTGATFTKLDRQHLYRIK